jgi:hypothetical protein
LEEERLAEERRLRDLAFEEMWGELLEAVKGASKDIVSWEDIKQERYDMFVEHEEEEEAALRMEEEKKLRQMARAAAFEGERDEQETLTTEIEGLALEDENKDEDSDDEETMIKLEEDGPFIKLRDIEKERYGRIELTPHAKKWFYGSADPKYRSFFIRRLKQLSRGDRSRILQKRLTGSKKNTIYETYLEQKSGFRILWTENGQDILIWYVSPHDKVSMYRERIDKAEERTIRQQMTTTSAATLPGVNEAIEELLRSGDLSADNVMIDPQVRYD